MSNFRRILNALPLAGAMLLAACGGSAGDAPRENQHSSDIVVGEPNGGGPVLSAFTDQARKADCAELNNRVYLIDQKYVFWTRAGNCPDNGYSHVLYGATPDALLCSQGDTIAGPRTSCTDPALRPMFDRIVDGGYNMPNLGLPDAHQVVEVGILPKDGGSLTFGPVAHAAFSSVHAARNVVIRDEAALAALWTEHARGVTPAPAMPKVDFSTRMVLGVFAGDSSACRELAIRRVAVAEGKVLVEYENRDISPVTICVAAVTAPMQLVSVKRIDATVGFAEIAPEAVAYTTLEQSSYSRLWDSRNVVVRDQATWAALWREHYNGGPGDPDTPPAVDFTKDMVIGVFGGGGSSGCSSSAIGSIYRARGRISVNSIHSSPQPGSMVICTMALTFPAHIVKVARSDDPVEFSAQVNYWSQ